MKKISAVVTGGAGFIGGHLVNSLLADEEYENVIVIDSLTYASNLSNLDQNNPRLKFYKADIATKSDLEEIFKKESKNPLKIFHLAAESHVDRSINSGIPFVHANLMGTQTLLEVSLQFNVLRFLHVSTDEVYGSLENGEASENSELKPSSSYSASKAGSDLLVLAMATTHGLDTLITRCVNNYGTNQAPEKFIPRMILNALAGKELPIYGDGSQIREWISVHDHVAALRQIMNDGERKQIYNIGSGDRKTNLEIAKKILSVSNSTSSLVFIQDRKGHDLRYALNSSYLGGSLGWRPHHDIDSDLPELVGFYRSIFETSDLKNKFQESEALYESI